MKEANDEKNKCGERKEKEDLKNVFDSIADEFAETRQHPWSEVEEFVQNMEKQGVAVDLGCGNGRHLSLLSEYFERVVGVDFSRELLELAQSESEVVQADVTSLPIKEGAFNCAVYIAALHHLPTHESRIESLNEVARTLDENGKAIISVWALEHPKFDGNRDKIREKGHDIYVPWKSREGDEEHDRFYHIYNEEGFKKDLAESELEVEEVYLSSGNYYAEVGTQE